MVFNWRNIDYENAKNLGYFLYEPSTFRIFPNQNPNSKTYLTIMPLKGIIYNKVSELKIPKP